MGEKIEGVESFDQCPKCGEYNIDTWDMYADSNVVSLDMQCSDCGYAWDAYFRWEYSREKDKNDD